MHQSHANKTQGIITSACAQKKTQMMNSHPPDAHRHHRATAHHNAGGIRQQVRRATAERSRVDKKLPILLP